MSASDTPPIYQDAENQGVLRTEDLRALASYYGLGRIRSLRVLNRGSGLHSKSVLQTDHGEYFLKYRSGKAAGSERIEEAHRVHRHLRRTGFPVPSLLVAPGSERTLFERNGAVYELTQFIHGTVYDRSRACTHSAGLMLARFHHAVAVMKPPNRCEVLSRPYHDETEVVSQLISAARQAVKRTQFTVSSDELEFLFDNLLSRYRAASCRAEEKGFFRWPRMIAHGDWHPGNLLFQSNSKVAAVLDLDSMRFEPRIADVANGLLQFSMQGGGNDPEDWPTEPDEERLTAFCKGYDDYNKTFMLSSPEIEVIPYLMIEALIAESLAPIASTGAFLNIAGDRFLRMVNRKIDWLMACADQIPPLLGE